VSSLPAAIPALVMLVKVLVYCNVTTRQLYNDIRVTTLYCYSATATATAAPLSDTKKGGGYKAV